MVLSLKVNGIPGMQRKLNPSVLYAPAIAEGMLLRDESSDESSDEYAL